MRNVSDYGILEDRICSTYRKNRPDAHSENLMLICRWYFYGEISFDEKVALMKKNDRLLARCTGSEVYG